MRIRNYYWATWFVGSLLCAGVSGCGASPPKPADPEVARQTLDRALTAWKSGKTVDSLKEDSPPIVVNDHAWSGGAQLIKYEVGKTEHSLGADRRFDIVLWLKDSKGKEKKEKTEYRVGTAPVLTVVRYGFN
jgi:hypothetical protein